MLSDYNQIDPQKKEIEEITNIGLHYSLLTEYTSFIAIDTEKRNQDGQMTTVKQPLPLPQGVPQSAVGGAMSTTGVRGRWSKGAAKLSSPVALEQELADVVSPVAISDIHVDLKSKDQQVSEFINNQQGMFEYCYQKHLKALGGASVDGKVDLWIEFDSSGRVLDVKITDDDLEDSDLLECIVDKIKRWHLLNYKNKNKLEVTITLNFGITN